MPKFAGTPGAMPLYRMRIANAEQGWSRGRPAVDLFAGDVAQADGRALRLRRLIDRRADRYVEQLNDPATERLIKYVDEPLSMHTGHGDDKPRPYRRRQARRN
jgi:hypothetical protein